MIQPQRIRQLLKQLVDIYSPSGKEQEITDFLKTYLQQSNLNVTLDPVDEKRCNILVLPRGNNAKLAFIGHIDTVAAYDLDEYTYKADGDTITGLGTADMKGGCAAMIEAFLAVHDSGKSHIPAALCLVVGEEETGDGARNLIKTHHFPWAIIGEPTNMKPCFRCFGYLEVELTTMGRRIHASMSDPRQNPVTAMLRKILRLVRYFETGQSEMVYNIRDIFSSRAGFAVPERCEAWIDIHVPPDAPIDRILSEIETIFMERKESIASVRTGFRRNTIDPGYEIQEKGDIADILQSVFHNQELGWETDVFYSHSDANQLWHSGVKPIILGPGRLSQAHTADESVSFNQVLQAAEIYYQIIQRL